MGQLCLNSDGWGILFRRRDKFGGSGTGDQFLVGMGKQKEAEAKENDHDRCCDNAERDEVEQGADIRLPCPGALIRGIGERTRCFGRLCTRVSGPTSRRELSHQLVEQLLPEHSAVRGRCLASPARDLEISDAQPTEPRFCCYRLQA
jgi:hypothetical protein